MEINITLIIQMLHFGVAYILIDRLFLRSACAQIAQEDFHKHQLEQQALHQQERVDALTQQNEQDWRILQKRLSSEAPLVSSRAQHETMPSVIEEPLTPLRSSQKVLSELTDSLAQDIVHKVIHD